MSSRLCVVLSMAISIGLSAPASAQDHSMAGMRMPMNMPMPESKPAQKPVRKTPVAPVRNHSKMDMSMPMDMPMHRSMAPARTSSSSKPSSGKPNSSKTAPINGMSRDRGEQPQSATQGSAHDMSGMDMSKQPAVVMPVPPLTDADRAAAMPPTDGHTAHDNTIQDFTLVDRFEGWNANPGPGLAWEGRTWVGTDLNRVWLRTEGQRSRGRNRSADFEVLYGHSISPWWDVLVGGRHDFGPGASQDFAAIGVAGTAPYKLDVQATAYIGQAGQTSARIEAHYDTLLTNRLILQPLVELNIFGENDARRGIGSGLSTIDAGLRLRYQITRQFAPYVGVVSERAFGRTADLQRDSGNRIRDTRVVAGVSLWF